MTKEAKEWAVLKGFSIFASNETILNAYESHLRIIARINARKGCIA